MGFPVGYSELPRLLLHLLLLLAHLRRLINFLLQSLGLSSLLDSEAHRYEPRDHGRGADRRRHLQDLCSDAAELIRGSSPAVQFGDLLLMAEGADEGRGLPETCAVCLCEFEGGHEVRRMNSCLHVFHRRCVDRWLEHGQLTCPMCRTKVVPDGAAAPERARGAGTDVVGESPVSMHAAAPSWASSSSFLLSAAEC